MAVEFCCFLRGRVLYCRRFWFTVLGLNCFGEFSIQEPVIFTKKWLDNLHLRVFAFDICATGTLTNSGTGLLVPSSTDVLCLIRVSSDSQGTAK